MKRNMGNVDKVIRLVLALIGIIIALAKVVTGTWATIVLIISAILIITSLLRYCPLYVPFGINTSKKNK
jgi:hypothetical protein